MVMDKKQQELLNLGLNIHQSVKIEKRNNIKINNENISWCF
jgi:hypothetical protein